MMRKSETHLKIHVNKCRIPRMEEAPVLTLPQANCMNEDLCIEVVEQREDLPTRFAAK